MEKMTKRYFAAFKGNLKC